MSEETINEKEIIDEQKKFAYWIKILLQILMIVTAVHLIFSFATVFIDESKFYLSTLYYWSAFLINAIIIIFANNYLITLKHLTTKCNLIVINQIRFYNYFQFSLTILIGAKLWYFLFIQNSFLAYEGKISK